MNTDNFNNNQQQLFEEPAFIDGVAGKKELPAEPQFISGAVNRNENLTPLYADQTRPDPYHTYSGNNDVKPALPLYGEEQKPIYADQIGINKLYPGQENFVGQQMNAVNGKEVLTSGGVVQAAYVPPNYGEELKREEKTEHFNITKENQHVQLPPDTEHLHITAEPVVGGNVEQVIRIKPDGRVTVAAEKIVEEEHKREVKVEKEHKKTKKDTKKKKHVEKVKHVEPEETTTVVRVIEHDGTGHPTDKHDETHSHDKKDKHDETHNHGKKDKHDETHVKKEHVTHNADGTKVKVNKEHHAKTHSHGKKDKHDKKDKHADTHTTKVKVNKEHHAKTHSHVPFVLAKHAEDIDGTTEEHGNTGKKKRSSGKNKGDKSETTTVVKETEHEAGTEGKDKIEKTEKSKHHHGTDGSKVKVEKEEHQHTI